MPTFSAMPVGRIASAKEKSSTQKKRSPVEETGARPRLASPILYTTPKTTPLTYIARSFNSSPYVINYKRRVPPSTVVVERIEAKDAVSQNGFLLVDRDQECGDTQQGKIDKLGDNGVDLVKHDRTFERNCENLIEIDDNLDNCDGKKAIEEVQAGEENVVAEKMGSSGDFFVKNDDRLINDEENTALEEDENREIEEVRVGEHFGAAGQLERRAENWVNDGEKLVLGDEHRAIDIVRVTEESWVEEKNCITEKTVNQELSVEIGRFEVGGANAVLRNSVECDQVDEGILKPYSCSTEFSPKNTEVYCAANGKENVAMALNMKKLPISGWSRSRTTYGRNEHGDVAESECCLKNNGDVVFQSSPGDGDYTPRTNRTDFFDAEDDLFTEDEAGQSTRSFNSRLHAELDCLRTKISKESERRISAEEALSVCQNIWQESMEKFSVVGLSLPSIEIGACQGVKVTTVDVSNDVCGQLTIARTVANAVARASGRAEIEREFEVLIDNKNSEISRLHDKLKYYELVNHEMSQRNQEAMELARRHRQIHKKKQRWIWGSFAVSFVIGTTALSYTHIPWAQMKDRVPLVCSRFNIHRMTSSSI